MWINEYYDIDIAYCYKFINNSWLFLEMFIFLWEKKTIKKALLLINPNPSVYSQRNKSKPNLNAYHVKNVTSWFFLCFDIFWFISLPIAYYVWKSRLEIKNLNTMRVFSRKKPFLFGEWFSSWINRDISLIIMPYLCNRILLHTHGKLPHRTCTCSP